MQNLNSIRYTTVLPLIFQEGLIFQSSCTFRAQGNNVFFSFEDTEDPVTSLVNKRFNVAAIVQTEYMDNPNSIVIKPHKMKSHTDSELVDLINCMNSKGLRVMLKPHVDVSDDSWRGDIKPQNKEQWFRAYTDFIAHYAEIAEAKEVEALVIGTEFKSLNGNNHRNDWSNVVKRIREVYSGKLTYAANWDDYKNVCLWDLVDFVGIDAYFPTSTDKDPSLQSLISGWSKWKEELDEWQKKVNKDIVFTELGYRSIDYAAREPWEYLQEKPINQKLQARCYEALIEAFKEKPWFKGVLFWNWMPRKDYGGKFNTDFTPQHKPAEDTFKN